MNFKPLLKFLKSFIHQACTFVVPVEKEKKTGLSGNFVSGLGLLNSEWKSEVVIRNINLTSSEWKPSKHLSRLLI